MKRLTMPAKPVLVMLVVAAAALAVLLWQASIWRADQVEDDRRAAAVETAEAQVLDLTTMNPTTVKANMESLAGRLSGDFKRQFDGFSSAFVTAVTDDKISATGQVTGSAITEYDDDSATVIVASTAEVATGKAQKVARGWRFSVELERSGDTWLISGMEFVQ